MTTPYVGSPQFRASIQVPADDDEPTGALFDAPLMDLRDECMAFREILGIAPRVRYLPIAAIGRPSGTVAVPWFYDALLDNSGWVQGTSTGQVYFEITNLLIAGAVLTAVQVVLRGTWNGNVHVGAPTYPSVKVISIQADGSVATVAGPTTDTPISFADYELTHPLNLGGLPITADGSGLVRYVIVVTGESGANYVSNALVVKSISVNVTGP